MREYLQLAKNHQFAKLWGSQILSQVAQNLLYFTLIIRVFELAAGTRFANISVALVVLAFGVPAIFFGVLAGTYVDHWNRKWVLVICNVVRAGIVLLFPLVETNLFAVLALGLAFATASQFFVPAEGAAIPKLVKKPLLTAANSLFVFSLYAAFILGYAGAAVGLKVLGEDGPYQIAAVMLAIAAVLDILLPTLKAEVEQKTAHYTKEARSVFKKIRHNLTQILKKRELSYPIVLLAITQSVVGIILALAPALSQALLKVPLTDATHILLIPAGVGLVLGVVACSQLSRYVKPVNTIAYGFVVASVTLTALGLSGLLYRNVDGQPLATVWELSLLVGAIVFVLGFINAVISVTAQTMLHENSTDESRGNLFGVLNTTVNVAATMPVFFAGILADLFSVTKVIMVIGVLLTFYGIYQLGAISRDAKLTK